MRAVARTLRALTFLVVPIGLSACGEDQPTSPREELPIPGGADEGTYLPPPNDFEHEGMVIGGIVFEECNGWREEFLPPNDSVTVDLYFPFGPHTGPPDPTPKPQDAQAVVDAGGRIIRQFEVSVIRARLPRERLDAMEAYPRLDHARAVPDPSRFDVSLAVGAKGNVQLVKERFEELGGFITKDWTRVGAFRGVIPSDSVPALRTMGMGSVIQYMYLPVLTCVW